MTGGIALFCRSKDHLCLCYHSEMEPLSTRPITNFLKTKGLHSDLGKLLVIQNDTTVTENCRFKEVKIRNRHG